MEISFSSNSTTDDHIATTFGTWHDSPAVVPCAKYCSDHFISIWMRAKWNFHHIWNVMEKMLVKWAPVVKLTFCAQHSFMKFVIKLPVPSWNILGNSDGPSWATPCITSPSAIQGPVSVSDKTSYHKMLWWLEAARFVFRIVWSLWNLTGINHLSINVPVKFQSREII